MAPLLLRDWFYLADGRDNLEPNAVTDSRLILCHEHLVSDDILGSIERRFAANKPVKMLLYGDWGVGKTHTINHISWWLKQHHDDFPARTVAIEIGDIAKNTKFNALVHQFLDTLGLDFVIRLTHAYLTKHANVMRALEERGIAPHVAEAFTKFLLVPPGETPSPIVLQAFEYIKGRKPAGVATQLGFGPQLVDSTDLYAVLLAVAELHLGVHGYRIIFIADEAAKLEAVSGDDATLAHWVNVNKLIFDGRNNTFGFIYTFSGRRDDLPPALWDPQIQNRLGENVFELRNLAPDDVGSFLSKLRDAFVNREKVEAALSKGEIPRSDYDWDSYPFTRPGLAAFIDHFSRAQEDAKPRDISNKLDDVAFVAAKSGKRLIDEESLRKAQM